MKRLFLLLIPYLVFGYVENHDSMQTSFIKIYGAGPKGGSIKDTAFKNSRVKFDANGFMVRDTIPDSVRAAGKADLSKHADTSDSCKGGSARAVHAISSDSAGKSDSAHYLFSGGSGNIRDSILIDPTITHTYDGSGNVLTSTTCGITFTFTHNTDGTIATKTATINGTAYTWTAVYNADGTMESWTKVP